MSRTELPVPVAAIDIGTNTVRLLVTRGGRDLVRRTEVTGLGRGLADSGVLNPVGRQRALDVFVEFAASMLEHGVGKVRAVATSASRDAADSDSFMSQADGILGIRPEVIGGEEEAALSYEGATADLAGEDWTVADIGGGSTEIISSQSGRSFDVGSVRLTDRFLDTKPAGADAIRAARRWADSVLGDVDGQSERLIGVAGTWTTVAALAMELDPYDPSRVHHVRLQRSVVAEWRERLSGLSDAETAELPGLAPGRAPVILGGVIVAEAVMDRLGADQCLVSEKDLLDGIAARLVAS